MKKFILSALVLAPTLAFAQNVQNPGGSPDLNNLQRLLSSIGRLVELALPIVVGLALLGFFWGLMKFVFAAGNEDAKEQGRRIMIWGVIALFVMVSVWGLVGFIGSALGIGRGGEFDEKSDIPTVDIN